MYKLFFLLTFACSFSFGQMPKWIQGKTCFNASNTAYSPAVNMLRFYEVDFTSGSPVFSQRTAGTSISNITSIGMNEIINNGIDANGNVSFYVFAECNSPYSMAVTDNIRFVAFDPLTNADEIFATIPGNPTTASSVRNIEVVPKAGSPNFYYVIYKTACVNNLFPDEIRYVTVDMNTKTISTSTLISSGNNNEGMGISKLDCSTNQRWFFFSKFSGGNLEIYKSSIGSSGISTAVLVNNLTLSGVSSLGQGDLEISPDGTKLAIAMLCTSNANEDVLLFDLNNATGTLSNYRWINNPTNYIFSLEFSPDSQRLYLSLSGTSAVSNKLFNIAVPGSNYSIVAASDQIPVSLNPGLISIEMGFDQKLYFNQAGYITRMMVISNPNTNALGNVILQTPLNSYGVGNHSGDSFPDQIDGDFTASSNTISLASSQDTVCVGQNVFLTASGGTNYTWSNNLSGNGAVQTVSPLATNTYYVNAYGVCGSGMDSITITVLPVPMAQINGDQEICASESVTLYGSGSSLFSWNGFASSDIDSIVINPLVTTTYSLVTSNGFCSSSLTNFTVTVHPVPQIGLIGDSTICEGEGTTFTANILSGTPPFAFLWSDGSANVSDSFVPLNDQELGLTITDQFNCVDSAKIQIVVQPVAQADFSLSESGCAPLSVTIQNESQNASVFTWIYGDGSISSGAFGNHVYDDTGVYSVTLIASNGTGCSDTITISNSVEVLATPSAGFIANQTDLSNPTSIVFTNQGSGSDSCFFDFGDGTFFSGCDWNQLTHNYTEETYTVIQVLTNDLGCVDTVIYVLDLQGQPGFYVPNAFTPDGDEYNNMFYVVLPENAVVNRFSLLIFNRWGEIIFESNNAFIGWDGTYHNQLVQDGVYTWKLLLDLGNQGSDEYSGHVVVKR